MINAIKRHAVPAGLCLLLAGCNSQEGPRVIHESEIKSMGNGKMPMDAVHGFAAGQPLAPSQSGAPEIGFDAPEGWAYEPGTGMRAATFKIKDGEGGKEATIIILPDANEGYASNIRRWLGQLGQNLSEQRLESFVADREAFSTIKNNAGALFDFTRLKGIPDSGKGSMLASIIDAGEQTIFIKMMGNEPFLRRNKEKFLKLSKSIRINEGESPNPSEGPEPGMTAGSPMGGDMTGNTGGSMTMQSSDPAFNKVPDGVSRLTWQTPPGWKSLEAKGMRTGSFAVAYEGKTADGSIVQLPGPAGGIESNVRRWMEQAGLAQMDDNAMKAFLESQKRIRTKDGHDGILINTAALLNGSMLQENSILAVIINAPDETIFVKLTGPRSVLLENVDALAKLSASLAIAD